MTGQVAISEDEPVLSMHDPTLLASLHGMEVVELDEAPDSAVKCSMCFEEQDSVLYDFPYTEEGVPI